MTEQQLRRLIEAMREQYRGALEDAQTAGEEMGADGVLALSIVGGLINSIADALEYALEPVQ
jgi:hypothetical protein